MDISSELCLIHFHNDIPRSTSFCFLITSRDMPMDLDRLNLLHHFHIPLQDIRPRPLASEFSQHYENRISPQISVEFGRITDKKGNAGKSALLIICPEGCYLDHSDWGMPGRPRDDLLRTPRDLLQPSAGHLSNRYGRNSVSY
jgi:hypothetical protein